MVKMAWVHLQANSAEEIHILTTLRCQKTGYVYQDFNLIPILAVKENIIMPILLDLKEVDANRLKQIIIL